MSDPGSKASGASNSSFRVKARAVVFVLVTAFIVLGPLSRQFMEVRTPHLRAWVMFSGIGLGAMDVRFFEQHRDGSRTELDPFAELGTKRPKKASDRRLKGTRSVWRVARAICESHGYQIDLRVLGRRAATDGWQHDFVGKKNLCENLKAEKPERRGRKRRGRSDE